MPIITSLSTRFLGQPRDTKPIFSGFAVKESNMRTSEDGEGVDTIVF
jgi:hypothetical protein